MIFLFQIYKQELFKNKKITDIIKNHQPANYHQSANYSFYPFIFFYLLNSFFFYFLTLPLPFLPFPLFALSLSLLFIAFFFIAF
jgi:hypothetical protein